MAMSTHKQHDHEYMWNKNNKSKPFIRRDVPKFQYAVLLKILHVRVPTGLQSAVI